MSDTDTSTAKVILAVAAVALILFVGGFSLLAGIVKIAFIGLLVLLVVGAAGWVYIHSDSDN